MREHDGAQLILLAALTAINILATLAFLFAYNLAPRLTAVAGTAPLGFLWTSWIVSLVDWMRGTGPLELGAPLAESSLFSKLPVTGRLPRLGGSSSAVSGVLPLPRR